jgi:seryl-tRNA synthetase
LQAKESAEELKAEKAAIEKEAAELVVKANIAEAAMRKKGQQIGNIVHESVPVSESEVGRSAETKGTRRGQLT